MNIEKVLADGQLIHLFADVQAEMKERGLIRTGNVIGDLGEHYVVEYFNQKFPDNKMSLTRNSTRDVDATDKNGKKYSIKSTTTKATGVFHLPQNLDSSTYSSDHRPFDYLFICMINRGDLRAKSILSLSWEKILKCKRWSKQNRGWSISVPHNHDFPDLLKA